MTQRGMTLFPIFVAACEVCCCEVNKQNHIWGEATAVSIKSLQLPAYFILEAQTVWLMAAHHAILYCFIDCVANADNSLPAARNYLIYLKFSCYHSKSCMSLVKWCPCKTARQNNSFPP